MINSQIPFNKLPLIDFRLEELSDGTLYYANEAIRALDFLNGFLSGYDDELLTDYSNNLLYTELKNSLELEGFPVSLQRIFEAENSENALQDELLSGIIEYHSKLMQIRQLHLEAIKPSGFRQLIKNADQFRERREHTIKSYFTNLTLYTAPVQTAVLQALRQDLESYISNKNRLSSIIAGSIAHYQVRAMAPFNHFNGVSARTLHLQCLRVYGLDTLSLPISSEILKQKESYQALMRDAIQTGNLEAWHQFMTDIILAAASKLPKQLKALSKLKKKLVEQIDKYTDYSMPTALAILIMKQPFIKVIDLVAALTCHRQTAATYLKHLVKMGILVEKSSGREKLYLNKELLDILAN